MLISFTIIPNIQTSDFEFRHEIYNSTFKLHELERGIPTSRQPGCGMETEGPQIRRGNIEQNQLSTWNHSAELQNPNREPMGN